MRLIHYTNNIVFNKLHSYLGKGIRLSDLFLLYVHTWFVRRDKKEVNNQNVPIIYLRLKRTNLK